MALHHTGAKIGMSVVLFFVFAGWAITLGGLGNSTQECREDTDAWRAVNTGGLSALANEGGHLQPFPDAGNFAGLGSGLTFGDTVDEERAYDCGIHFSLDWWILAYEFFLIIYGYLAVWTEVFHSKHSVMTMFNIATFLYTIFASIYIKLGYYFEGGSHSENKVAQGYKTNIAGAIIVLVCNYVFMFVFGSEERVPERDGSS